MGEKRSWTFSTVTAKPTSLARRQRHSSAPCIQPSTGRRRWCGKALRHCRKPPSLAFVYFANAAQALPERADIHALVGRSLLAQNHFELATRYLTTAWQKQPNDLALRLTLWQARSQSEHPAELRRIILAHLPDIHTGQELAHVLKLLAGLADTPTTVGVARYVPEQQVIQGWAIDLRNLQAPVALKLQANGIQADTSASAAHPLLSAAGLPGSHGGFRIRVPNPTAAVHLYFADGTPCWAARCLQCQPLHRPHQQAAAASSSLWTCLFRFTTA